MSQSPASPRTPSRFSAGFFTGRRRRQSAPTTDGVRPTSTVSYLSADFDAIDGPVMPVSPSQVPIECSGNLHKHGRIFRGWKTRYFELQGPHLYYYKDDSKARCLGEIDLNFCADVKPSTLASFGHTFDIITTKRVHTLAARTEEDMKQWISFIDVHMAAVELPEKKATKKRPPMRAESQESGSSGQPAKRNKSFVDRIKSFRIMKRRSHSEDKEEEEVIKQARSEDNILSPPSADARPTSPLVVTHKSTPVSREDTPHHDESLVELNPELQEYYGQKFVFDEVKEFLDTRADDEAAADVLEELNAEEHPWMKEESAMEQLSGFLDTCP